MAHPAELPSTRLMGVLEPLKMRLLNWPDPSDIEELSAPLFPGGPLRTLPFGQDLLIEKADFFPGEHAPLGFRRLCVGSSVKLRFAYIVTCESFREEGGDVIEVCCRYEPSSRSQFGAGGNTCGRLPKGVAVVHWVHSERHELLRLDGGVKSEAQASRHIICEPYITSGLSYNSEGRTLVQFERLGSCEIQKSSSETIIRWVSQSMAPMAAELTGTNTEMVERLWHACQNSENTHIDEKPLELVDISQPLLLICAAERWDYLMKLELRLARLAAGRDPNSLAQVAQGLYSINEHCNLEGDAVLHNDRDDGDAHVDILGTNVDTFNVACPWHLAGLRRTLKLLCAPQAKAADLVKAAQDAKLCFPNGFSLEVEAPYPIRHESTAPYVPALAYLPAALGRVINGPLIEEWSNGDEYDAQKRQPTRLVILQTVSPELFLLAEEHCLQTNRAFDPESFCREWRVRPYPDYSAALEPLGALAIVSVALRIYQKHSQFGLPYPVAFLDPSCGAGTLSAAARHCGAHWSIFAGDISEKMAHRTWRNLDSCFPRCQNLQLGNAQMLLDVNAGRTVIGVRQWDATQRWPLPELPGLGKDGSGLIVVANLPWGGSLKGQENDAAGIVRCLSTEFPRALLCLIISESLRQLCISGHWVQILYEVPAGKKAVILYAVGASS